MKFSLVLLGIVVAVAGEAPFYSNPYSNVYLQRSIQPRYYTSSSYRVDGPQYYLPSSAVQFQQYQQLQQAQQTPVTLSQVPQVIQVPEGSQIPQVLPVLPSRPRVPLPSQQPTYYTPPGAIPFIPPTDVNTNTTEETTAKDASVPKDVELTTEGDNIEVTTEDVNGTTTEEVTTERDSTKTEKAEKLMVELEDGEEESEDLKENEELVEEGVYYIYHPSGLLQKVAYNARNNFAKMDYTAMLKYENVDPIKDPIYTYDPDTFVFSQVSV